MIVSLFFSVVNLIVIILLIRENNRLRKKLVEQIDVTLDALNQSKARLADNISLLKIIEGSDTKEQIVQKYALNESLKK